MGTRKVESVGSWTPWAEGGGETGEADSRGILTSSLSQGLVLLHKMTSPDKNPISRSIMSYALSKHL